MKVDLHVAARICGKFLPDYKIPTTTIFADALTNLIPLVSATKVNQVA